MIYWQLIDVLHHVASQYTSVAHNVHSFDCSYMLCCNTMMCDMCDFTIYVLSTQSAHEYVKYTQHFNNMISVQWYMLLQSHTYYCIRIVVISKCSDYWDIMRDHLCCLHSEAVLYTKQDLFSICNVYNDVLCSDTLFDTHHIFVTTWFKYWLIIYFSRYICNRTFFFIIIFFI